MSTITATENLTFLGHWEDGADFADAIAHGTPFAPDPDMGTLTPLGRQMLQADLGVDVHGSIHTPFVTGPADDGGIFVWAREERDGEDLEVYGLHIAEAVEDLTWMADSLLFSCARRRWQHDPEVVAVLADVRTNDSALLLRD